MSKFNFKVTCDESVKTTADQLLEKVSQRQIAYLSADRKESESFWKAHNEWIEAIETYKAFVRR